jgi:hypothetical protein
VELICFFIFHPWWSFGCEDVEPPFLLGSVEKCQDF